MAPVDTQDSSPLIDIGVPVRACSWSQLLPGRARDGTPMIYAVMGQVAANFFVLQIDPDTGQFRQFHGKAPKSNHPTAKYMSRSGQLYVGASQAGRLYRFDPDADELQDLGEIAPDMHNFTCRIDEDSAGRIWIGGFPSADLTCFDPSDGSFTRHGRIDEVDMYNYPWVNADGTIANLVRMTRPHVVVFDPKTGRREQVGPVAVKGKDKLEVLKARDGSLFIKSSLGHFRLDGFEAVPVDHVPEQKTELKLNDGRTCAFADAQESIFRKVRVGGPSGESRVFEVDYDAAGTEVYALHAGPDGLLYGSSMLPEHLFRYDPGNAELVDLGKCSTATGEAYSMANLNGKLYISSYPAAVLSVYDPARPYRFGNGPEDNPRDLGRMDAVSYRPRSTLAGPLGRVWLASVPDYGMWGGPLSCYDPASGEKRSFPIAGDASCYTLAHLEQERLLAVGTTINGGSGTQPKVECAELILWDYGSEEEVWRAPTPEQTRAINSLLVLRDGNVLLTAARNGAPHQILVFDPKSRTFSVVADSPGDALLDLGLQHGAGGHVYGFSRSCLYRLDAENLGMEVLIRAKKEFHQPGPIIGDHVYYAHNEKLKAIHLP